MTKYDDADFHEGAALEAGHPAANGFTHIGLYLAWLIRHEMVDPEFFSPEDLSAVNGGTMTGSDLQSDVDGKLMSDMLTSEGSAFSDWYYEKYLDDYSGAFPDGGDYTVVDDTASRASIDPILDRRYAEWSELGRPKDSVEDIPEYVFTPKYGPNDPMPSIDQVIRDLQESLAKQGIQAEVGTIVDMSPPHAAPLLEALVPAELGFDMNTVTAAQWGDSKLRRALKQLNIPTKNAYVANGMRKADGGGVLAVTLYGVAGVRTDDLEAEFTRVLRIDDTEDTGVETVGSRRLHRSTGPDWVTAWWARDGLVVSCSAPDEAALADLIAHLP